MGKAISEEDLTHCRAALRRCKRQLKNLSAGALTPSEFNFDLEIFLIGIHRDGKGGCWVSCLNLLPVNLLVRFDSYLRERVNGSGAVPYPGAFVVDASSKDEVELLERDLKPRYLELCENVRKLLIESWT